MPIAAAPSVRPGPTLYSGDVIYINPFTTSGVPARRPPGAALFLGS